MFGKKLTPIHISLAVLVLALILSYVSKPHAPYLELVDPRQELPTYTESYPDFRRLADRVAKSYSLALVLVQSQYSQKNAIALTAIRTWARQRFQQQPDFLIPIMIQPVDNTKQNFIGASLFNLWCPIQYWLEERVGQVIKWRIAAFHTTDAYFSFRIAYFELFDVDNDSAILLSRYQSDLAKQAIDVCIMAGFLLIAAALAAAYVIPKQPGTRTRAYQRVLAISWLVAASGYMIVGWNENEMSNVISALVAAAIGLYLLKPFKLNLTDDSASLTFFQFPTNRLSVAYWASFTLLVIQAVTWMRTGTPNQPDPISLVLASFTGNFVHDPVHAKKIIMQVLGIAWAVFGGWALTRPDEEARARRQVEETLAALQGPG